MTILHTDGFEGYGVNGDHTSTAAVAALFNQEYIGTFNGGGSTQNLIITTGVSYGFYLDWVTGTIVCNLRKSLGGSYSTLIIGFRLFVNSDRPIVDAISTLSLFKLLDNAGATQCAIGVDGNGVIGFYRGTSATRTASSSASACPVNQWVHFETKIVLSNTGSYEVRVNGTDVFSNSSFDTTGQSGTTADAVEIYGCKFKIDDFYILDSAGSVNNDFLGPNTVIKTLYPDGDNSVAWTRSTGSTNYSLVDDTGANGDTDYVETNTATQKDLYDIGAISGVASVKGIQVRAISRVTGSMSHGLEIPVKSGATESAGSSTTIVSNTYASASRILETDPASGVAFTTSDISSLVVGIKKT